MEQEKRPKYEKPEIRELGRAGDDEMRAVGQCDPSGSGDFFVCYDGNSAGHECDIGTSAEDICWGGNSYVW
jgi:hypothetical protein